MTGKIGRKALAAGLLLLLGLLPWGCGSKGEQSRKAARLEETPLRADYQAAAQRIADLQELIWAHPTDPEARRTLVATAVDTVQRLLWAAGQGVAPQGAVSLPVALQAAERAALADAYRWLALLARWKDDYRAPDFGSVAGHVPGVRIVHVDTLGDGVRVLVAAPLP
ncbi:MAG: hypothetical protein ACUVWA_12900 [Candidatus Oleimicrobiaceae bacterium]